MNINDFDYELPKELIARYPLAKRSASRLLCLNRVNGAIEHKHFIDLIDYLDPKDLLIFNDTKVMPARLYGRKESGGKIEVLIEKLLDEKRALAHVRASKAPKEDTILIMDGEINVKVLGREHDLFVLEFLGEQSVLDVLNSIGHMPLPPYLGREDELKDKERYQTIFAKELGAIAAPTAALHFDNAVMKKLQEKNIETAFLTLHVGAGTFQPVRVDDISRHKMHAEYINVSDELCEKIKATKARGGRIVAAGTTVVRSLETASASGSIKPYQGETDIFIYPGYEFKCIDVLITNFHLPKSTLLMLVSALAGYDNIKRAYSEAIKEQYRFFSYGDAMLIY